MQNKMAKERLSNFWYYYKWPTLITALIVAILTFFTVQCATRTQADYAVVLYLNQSVSYEQRAALEEMLARSGEDINGDGTVKVEVFDVSFSNKETNTNVISANRIKAMGQMSLSDTMIYITDTVRFPEYKEYDLFSQLDWLPDQEGYAWDWQGSELEQTLTQFGLPEHLYFSLRRIEGTSIEDDAGVYDRLAQSEKLLRALVESDG